MGKKLKSTSGIRENMPKRLKDESPVEYYERTGCVDDRFTHKHKGFYYCNPAHCKSRWKNKKHRDSHLEMAYAALG